MFIFKMAFVLLDRNGNVLQNGLDTYISSLDDFQRDDEDEKDTDKDIHELYPNLFISNRITAENIDILREKKITCIISITNSFTDKQILNEYAKLRIDRYSYFLFDSPNENIKRVSDITDKIIDHYLSLGGRVLVHCEMGISRSASVVISYIMKKENKSYEQVLSDVRKIRKIINPNPGFVRQLTGR